MNAKVIAFDIYYHDWDYKDAPNWSFVQKCIEHCNNTTNLYEVDTNSDQYALIISSDLLEESDISLIKTAVYNGDETIMQYDPFEPEPSFDNEGDSFCFLPRM